MAFNYCIKIRQETDDRLERLSSWIPYDLFNLELHFRYLSPHFETSYHRSVMYARDMFLSQEFGPNIIFSVFSNTGASREFLQTVTHDVLDFAWEVDIDPVNLGRKVIKLLVEVIVQATDQVIDESLSTLNFKPASRLSIQSLKRVKLGDEDSLLPFKKRRRFQGLISKKQCTICLDELLDGDEVASMPCEHVYHGGCIVRWLETSNLCPLCRYQMPS